MGPVGVTGQHDDLVTWAQPGLGLNGDEVVVADDEADPGVLA
jgi:hypothetical protein